MAKVLHVSKFFPPYKGGIEDVAYAFIDCQRERHTHKVICFNDSSETIEDKYDDIDVLRVGSLFTLKKQPISPQYLYRLRILLREFSPDYIHLHMPNPLIAFFLSFIDFKGKIILHWHSDIIEQKFIYTFYKPFEKMIIDRAYKIIVTSLVYAECSYALSNYKDKIVCIPNFLTNKKIKLFRRSSSMKIHHQPIILFVGRHVKYKGLHCLLEAFSLLKTDAVLVIAGNGPLTKELMDKYKKPNIHFLGRISDSKLYDLFSIAKIFAFPSLTKNEAFGVALAEALYCGLPAITFNIPGSGVNWVNKSGHTGIEVQNGNIIEYASALEVLLCNNDLYQKYQINAVEWIKKNFTEDAVVDQLNVLYE